VDLGVPVVPRGRPDPTPDPTRSTVNVDRSMVNRGPLTGHISKWVPLADMATDVAATSAMTWLVGPTVICAGSRSEVAVHVATAGQSQQDTCPKRVIQGRQNKGACRALRCPPTFLEAS
ncbi:hypothetical protein Tco_1477503, partial [Tanacetum coccineum]